MELDDHWTETWRIKHLIIFILFVKISGMKLDHFYHLEYSDFCLHVHLEDEDNDPNTLRDKKNNHIVLMMVGYIVILLPFNKFNFNYSIFCGSWFFSIHFVPKIDNFSLTEIEPQQAVFWFIYRCVPQTHEYGTRPFLRWVRSQGRSPHASCKVKNTFDPVGIPLLRGASGNKPNQRGWKPDGLLRPEELSSAA